LQTVKWLTFTRLSALGDIVGVWHWRGQYCRKIAGKRRAGFLVLLVILNG
jgi:hypothetical protein